MVYEVKNGARSGPGRDGRSQVRSDSLKGDFEVEGNALGSCFLALKVLVPGGRAS